MSNRWVESFIAAFWALLAGGIIYFGNGEHDLIRTLLYNPFLHRRFLQASLAGACMNAAIYVYAHLWKEQVCGVQDVTHKISWVVPVGAFTFATSLVCMIVGLWPVFSFFAPVMVVLLLYGLVMGLSLLGGSAQQGVKRD
ncbi:MAG: hypothetical protein WDW38_008206 [Sanguina aurantia]